MNTHIKPPGGAQGAPLYVRTPVTPEEAFQAIGRLRKEARDEIDRLIRFLDESDNHMELEPWLGWPESTSRGGQELGGTDDREAEPEHDEEGADDEPSLGSHELPSGAICYLQSASLGEIDVEGDHDGREPSEDDEPTLGWNAAIDQIRNDAGSMHADEMEPSLGSTATINQEAWAFGMSADREQGTVRNFAHHPRPDPLSHCNVRWPDGSPVDLCSIRSNVVVVE